MELGTNVAAALRHRLAVMRAARSPRDLLVGQPRVVAGGKEMVLDLCDGHRLVFRSNHPLKDSDSADWDKVSRVKILRVEVNNA